MYTSCGCRWTETALVPQSPEVPINLHKESLRGKYQAYFRMVLGVWQVSLALTLPLSTCPLQRKVAVSLWATDETTFFWLPNSDYLQLHAVHEKSTSWLWHD